MTLPNSSIDFQSSTKDSETGSVTSWIRSMQQGSDSAIERLWNSHADRLIPYARKRFAGFSRAIYDEEDAVVSALNSVFIAVRKMGTHKPMDREALWKFMAVVTARKVYRRIDYGECKKRKNPVQQHGNWESFRTDVPESIASPDPTPSEMVEFEEQFRVLLEELPRTELKQIVVLKLEGYTNQEIACQLGRGISSIERKLKSIREIWLDSLSAESQ